MSGYILRKGVAKLEDLQDGREAINIPLGVQNVYYVDGTNGNDSDDGSSWDHALKTYLAARTLSNATINWSYSQKRLNAIVLAPGVYTALLNLFPYYCYVIGTGVYGTDTMTEFHPATGVVFSGTMLGTVFINCWFETNEANPIFDVGVCNNSAVIGCTFTNGAAVAATGIDTDNCTHLKVVDCDFESGQTTGLAYGFYFRGGADKYAHEVRIRDCRIFASTAGIWIQDTCTAAQMVVGPNVMIAGAAKGIDDNSGTSYAFGNFISGTDAIEHANSATQCIGNAVINNGTGARETAST